MNGGNERRASPERTNETVKYFIPSGRNRTYRRHVYSRTLVPLRHDGLNYLFCAKLSSVIQPAMSRNVLH